MGLHTAMTPSSFRLCRLQSEIPLPYEELPPPNAAKTESDTFVKVNQLHFIGHHIVRTAKVRTARL